MPIHLRYIYIYLCFLSLTHTTTQPVTIHNRHHHHIIAINRLTNQRLPQYRMRLCGEKASLPQAPQRSPELADDNLSDGINDRNSIPTSPLQVYWF